MNYTTAVFLINTNTRAILATYEATDNAPREMFKTLDPDIKVGDLVVVPTGTRHLMTVCKVVEVDVDPDYDSPTQMRWVVDRIDVPAHEKTLKLEAAAIQRIHSAQSRKKRDELREALLADSKDEIMALPISAIEPAVKK